MFKLPIILGIRYFFGAKGAFGSFYSSKTKKARYLARTQILNKTKRLTQIPLVAI